MDDDLRQRLADAIQGVLGPVPYVLVADISTPEEAFGDEDITRIRVTSPPHQPAYTAIGLCTCGLDLLRYGCDDEDEDA